MPFNKQHQSYPVSSSQIQSLETTLAGQMQASRVSQNETADLVRSLSAQLQQLNELTEQLRLNVSTVSKLPGPPVRSDIVKLLWDI